MKVETKIRIIMTGLLVGMFPTSLHPTHSDLDITNKEAVFDFMEIKRPEVLIHCAALTGIRECEQNQKKSWQVNVSGTENLIKACEKHQRRCYFIYISTACVFRGDIGNYVETDTPYPKNFYALTKLLGEFIIQYSRLSKWRIVRTNFVPREKWKYPRAFIDRFGTYLFADDVASAVASQITNNLTGLVHVCGEEKLSMFDLAKLTTPNVAPLTLAEYDGPPLTIDMSLKSLRISPFKITK